MPIGGPTTSHREIRAWADARHVVPTEVLPHEVDSEPTVMRMMLRGQADTMPDVRVISWEDFFAKFDELHLSFVYDEEDTGYNEILQIEEESTYLHPEYRSLVKGPLNG